MPDGTNRSFSRVSPARIVCPALLPPWQRTTRSEARARRSVAFPLPSSPHWVPTRIVTGTVGFYPARPCAPVSPGIAESLPGSQQPLSGPSASPNTVTRTLQGTRPRREIGTMVHAGTIADWLLITVLLGGLAAASWLIYAWVLGDEPAAE